jgi:membrane-bound lytic murein transglycosylase F
MLKKFSFVVLAATMLVAYESTVGQSHNGTAVEFVDNVISEECNTSEALAATVEEPCIIISRFDPIMREVGEEEGLDWRFMSAIAYSESRFIEDLKSSQGAMGIMQIRPVVARHFNVPVESINDTETNVRLAGMLLAELDTMLRIPASTPAEDRLSIILASYNAGIGHVMDARRLARSEGANPNSWEAVRYYLDLKADPAYYELDIVKSGRFTGSRQTEGYVNEVMRKYRQYCAIAS